MSDQAQVGQIYAAMVAAMKDLEAVGKNSTNTHQGYKFRGIDAVYNSVYGALSKHGIFTAPRVLERTVETLQSKNGAAQFHVTIKAEYLFTAADGSSMTVGPIYAEALDTSDKATNKAMAFAHKYALLQTFCIPTEDVAEGDKVTLEVGAPTQPEQVDGEPGETVTTSGEYGPILTYGLNKDQHASQLTRERLRWYAGNARKDLADATKKNFHKKTQALLEGLLAVARTKGWASADEAVQ